MQELAYRAGLSVHGIQKLERGATHPYGGTARRLIIAACPPGRTQVDRRQPRRGVAGRASAADRSVARPRRFGFARQSNGRSPTANEPVIVCNSPSPQPARRGTGNNLHARTPRASSASQRSITLTVRPWLPSYPAAQGRRSEGYAERSRREQPEGRPGDAASGARADWSERGTDLRKVSKRSRANCLRQP